MRLRLFRAQGMAEAMARVRAELGEDALILSTRRVDGCIEITAALEPEPEPEPEPLFTLPHPTRPGLGRFDPARPDPARLAVLTWHAVPADLHPILGHGDLEEAIGRALAFGVLPLNAHDNPVMLTGPPGAGKTLTAVRLATRLVMKGVTPLVITTDAKRAGATEQLAAFTKLLGVPLLVASHPVSLARALARRRDGAPVLIDTAGTDPHDPAQAEELKNLASVAGALVALVLPAGMDPAESADLAVAHAGCGGACLIATRLDLARRLGGVIAASAASRLPLTEAGIGPGAADGLTPFTPSLLAARLTRPERPSHGR